MDEKKIFRIGIAAKHAGISRQTLQYYIMLGLIEPRSMSSRGQRLFDDENVERIKLIRKLNDSGYPLRAIRELFLEGRFESKGK